MSLVSSICRYNIAWLIIRPHLSGPISLLCRCGLLLQTE